MSSTGSWICGEATAKWIHVPEGYVTTEEGYFGTIQDGKDTLAIIKSSKEEARVYKQGYNDIKNEFLSFQKSSKQQLAELKASLDQERIESRKRNVKNVILGVFGGAVIYAVFD